LCGTDYWSRRQWERSYHASEATIASKICSESTSTDVIAFANQLIIKVTPQTVANYLSHLAAVFAVARPAWGYPLDRTAMKDAFVVAKRLGMASKSRDRDRRVLPGPPTISVGY
jgi:hypothetical protein